MLGGRARLLLLLSLATRTAGLSAGPAAALVERGQPGYKRQHLRLAARSALGRQARVRPPGPRVYPIVGTLPSFLRLGGADGLFDVHAAMYRAYGDCYSMAILGERESVICDPEEFQKAASAPPCMRQAPPTPRVPHTVRVAQVFREEGQFPYGSSQEAPFFLEYYEMRGYTTAVKSMLDGPDWRDWRQSLTKDLFAKPAALSYIPLINSACAAASAVADRYAHEMDGFISRLAFDMFTEIMLGENPGTADAASASEEDLAFVRNAQTAFSIAGLLLTSPQEKLLQTAKYRQFVASMDLSMESAQQRVRAYTSRAAEAVGEGAASGCPASAVSRILGRGNPIMDAEAVADGVGSLLLAGVDTTAYVTNWLWINLARNPHAQRALATELGAELRGADLNAEAIDRLPYLQACVRESHRLTPPTPITGTRRLTRDIEMCGYIHPAGSRLSLNTVAFGTDIRFVEAPLEFRPERWLPAAVEARKGTPKAVIDHRLFATPFGSGARMCIGARLAEVEILAATARLFQDWEFELEPDQQWKLKLGLFFKAYPFPRFRLKPRR